MTPRIGKMVPVTETDRTLELLKPTNFILAIKNFKLRFKLFNWYFDFWRAKERPERMEGGFSNISKPFFWIYASCWSDRHGLPWIGEKLDFSGPKAKKHLVLRCPTNIQGNIGKFIFFISYQKMTTCHIDPIILKKIK